MTFEALYEANHRPVLRWFKNRPLTARDAEDWTSQTFAKAWANGGLERCVDDHHQRARVWLIARNLYNDEFRHRKAAYTPWFTPLIAGVHDVTDAHSNVPEQVEAGECYQSLLDVVTSTLPAKQARALLLTADGIPTPMIARCLGVEPVAVKALLYRARQNLLTEPKNRHKRQTPQANQTP